MREVPREKLLALSFDDGPDEATGSILDILSRHGAHATFFVLGQQVRGREEVLLRIRDEGHEIGNHTFTHLRIDEASRTQIENELTRASAEIERATGVFPRLMRPPYSRGAQAAASASRRLGLETVLWTNNPQDWTGCDEQTLARDLLERTAPNDVVVLHDGAFGGGDRTPTVEALHIVIPKWHDAGYRIVTISELFRHHPWAGRRHSIAETNRWRKLVRLGSASFRTGLIRDPARPTHNSLPQT